VKMIVSWGGHLLCSIIYTLTASYRKIEIDNIACIAIHEVGFI
jgi:hypothetical protein